LAELIPDEFVSAPEKTLSIPDSKTQATVLDGKFGSSTKENLMSKQSITTTAAQQFANSTVQQLDALFKTRENWEATDFKKSNQGLYALLAKCLEVYVTNFIKATDDERKALRSELKAKLTAAGVKVLKSTSSLMMIVRFVFNADRKRAHGYTTVLAAAIADGVSPADLPAYIQAAGGVEEIKRRRVKSAEAIAAKN
jgi:flagellar biosynthesis regulator FlaF